MPTNHPPKPCPYHRKCTFRYICEIQPGLFKYWSRYEAKCVKKHKSINSKKISPPRSPKTPNKHILKSITPNEKLKVVDESGRELSNRELRLRYGSGKGLSLKRSKS